MWILEDPSNGATNVAVAPVDGIISVTKPDTAFVAALVNGAISGVHHVHVKAGDTVQFKIAGKSDTPIEFAYNGEVSYIKPPSQKSLSSDEATEEEDMTSTDAVNLFANPGMGGAGAGGMAGLGAGLVGGLLGTTLFRNGGFNNGGFNDGYGGYRGDGGVPATLQGVESVVNNATIMQSLGDIKASIPLAEGQVQLALAGAQMDINNNVNGIAANIIGAVGAGNSTIMNNLNMQTQMTTKGFADTQATTVAVGNANMLATKDLSAQTDRNAWAITQSISTDGEKTRELIRSIDKTNDSRAITTLANEISELRNERRLHDVTGNITISNNNTATAVAQQQQAQQQQQQLTTLLAHVHALYDQNQRIQQGVLNIGSGTVAGNSQNAANTRVS